MFWRELRAASAAERKHQDGPVFAIAGEGPSQKGTPLDEEEQKAASDQDTWTCSCGAKNSGQFCSECGNKKTESKFCPECGEKLPENAKFCTKCGKKL